jgi:hypothetical protein
MFKRKTNDPSPGHFKEDAKLQVEITRDQLIELKQRALKARLTLREYVMKELKLKD